MEHTKQLLTPQQIAEKFIKPTNPFCGTEKRAVKDIQKDLVEYIQMAIDAKKPIETPVYIPDTPSGVAY